MRDDRPIPTKGQFLTGGAHPVDAKIKKGMFLTSTPAAGDAALIRQFPQFEETIRSARPTLDNIKERHAAHVSELTQRLIKLREQISTIKAKR